MAGALPLFRSLYHSPSPLGWARQTARGFAPEIRQNVVVLDDYLKSRWQGRRAGIIETDATPVVKGADMRPSPSSWVVIAVISQTWLAWGEEAPSPAPVSLDDCESFDARHQVWQIGDADAELSAEHVTSGKSSLKVILKKPGASLRIESRARPLDWSQHHSITFDAFNPHAEPVHLTIRIDDKYSKGYQDRFEPGGVFALPPGRMTRMKLVFDHLLTKGGRLLDPSCITVFIIYAPKVRADSPQTVFFDTFRLTPLGKGDIAPLPPAKKPLVIDNCESADKSKAVWKTAGVTIASSPDHATEGKQSLKVTFAPKAEWPGMFIEPANKPMDLRPYRTLRFDAHNPSAKDLPIYVRIDDANSFNHDSRFTANTVRLPAGETTTVAINIHRMVSTAGIRMDKSRIAKLILFMSTNAAERVIFIDNVRVDPVPGGVANAVDFGRIPGQNPVSLARELINDPVIKPLIPILKAIPPKRVAIISHSASMTSHSATSGSFFDIAAETVRLVNPGFQYKGFHRGMMSISIARRMFLKPALKYQPTDTCIVVFPTTWNEERDLMLELMKAGSNVYRFDSVLPWIAYSPSLLQTYRDFDKKHANANLIELVPRSWGAKDPYRWQFRDGHMTTYGHLFFARELLKEWARICRQTGQPPGLDETGEN